MPAPLGKVPTKKMPDIQVFGRDDSSATRAALRFFRERRIVVHYVDLKKRPDRGGRAAPLHRASRRARRSRRDGRRPTRTPVSATSARRRRDHRPGARRCPPAPAPARPPRQRGDRRPRRGDLDALAQAFGRRMSVQITIATTGMTIAAPMTAQMPLPSMNPEPGEEPQALGDPDEPDEHERRRDEPLRPHEHLRDGILARDGPEPRRPTQPGRMRVTPEAAERLSLAGADDRGRAPPRIARDTGLPRHRSVARAADPVRVRRGLRRDGRRRPAVTVFGSARTSPDDPRYELARAIGRRLAEAGYAVITGGGPGEMEAANRGCREGGGLSVGCNIELPHEQGAQPVRRPRRRVPLLLRAQDHVREVRRGVRHPARRLRHDGRTVRGADPHPDRQGPALPGGAGRIPRTGPACSTGSGARCSCEGAVSEADIALLQVVDDPDEAVAIIVADGRQSQTEPAVERELR